MADEDSMAALIANSAKTDPGMWEAIGNIPNAHYEGRDQAYKHRMRYVFSDGNGARLSEPVGAACLWSVA